MQKTEFEIAYDVLAFVKTIENQAIREFQNACSDVVIDLGLKDNLGRTINDVKLTNLVLRNKKVNAFLFDAISKQTIAVFTIITQGTPRVIYSNLNPSKKYTYQVHIIQNILSEVIGPFEDDQKSDLLVQISMNSNKSKNPHLLVKNVSYNSVVVLGLLSLNAITTLADPGFWKFMFVYSFFFPAYPFVMFFAPWPVLLLPPIVVYLFTTLYNTLNELAEP